MFKRQDSDFQPPDAPAPTFHHAPSAKTAEVRRETASIGPSISIKGDLTGEEDLVIEGRVDGKVDLKQNSVTIGRNGRIKADIYGKDIFVEGEVQGNLCGHERVVVKSTGNVLGNITEFTGTESLVDEYGFTPASSDASTNRS